MDHSEILKKVLVEEELTAEERQAHIQNLKADSGLARSLSGWQRLRTCLKDRIPSPRDFVLYSLVVGGYADDLTDAEAEETSEKWKSLDPVITDHPGFAEIPAQIERDREDFLKCWESEDIPSSPKLIPFRVYRMVAVMAFLVMSVIFSVIYIGNRDPSIQVATAKPGEYERVFLPDNSVVHLNGPATLRFDEENFVRSVELTGVGFFDITHQPDQFSVRTGQAIINVLGTRFGVRSQNKLTQVVLESGRVEVASALENPQRVVLVPGQMVSVAEGSITPSPPVGINIEDQLGWTGFLFFRNTSLRKAAVLLSTSRDIRVDVDPSLINESVTGTFAPDVAPEEILNALALTLNAQILTEGDTYRIVP